MIELPESRTLAKQIRDAWQGRRIAHAQAASSPHGFAFYTGDPGEYAQRLSGRTLTDAVYSGGLVELHLGEDLMLVFNDGINPRLYPAGAKLPPKHQLLLRFDDGSHLVCTVQMYGGMQLYVPGECDNFYYLVTKQRPSPLTDAFDRAYFSALLAGAKPNASAKAFLATEQRIPGLGNGCLQDILFDAGVHPQSKLSALGEDDLDRMFRSTRRVLADMAAGGGRDTEKDLAGNPGGYRTNLSSKTLAYPCPKCGGGLVRKAYLGGNVYFCPVCQPLKK